MIHFLRLLGKQKYWVHIHILCTLYVVRPLIIYIGSSFVVLSNYAFLHLSPFFIDPLVYRCACTKEHTICKYINMEIVRASCF